MFIHAYFIFIFTGSVVCVPDFDACSYYFVSAFREGKLGKLLLDMDSL